MSDLTATGGVPGPGRIGRVAVGDILRRAAKRFPDRIALTSPEQVKALSHPLRTTILHLLHERAATVSELARAVGRPKSTVAHHVSVLVDAGLLQVVRTRRVRAIDERFYGRTARLFYVSVGRSVDGACRSLLFEGRLGSHHSGMLAASTAEAARTASGRNPAAKPPAARP